MKKKLFYSLGSLAMILLLSGVISIIEYRRMSDYVSELIAANIKSINLAQKLSDITEEYNHQMLAVVVQNDISIMPEFDLDYFKAQADSLKNSFTSQTALPMVDSVEVSFDAFMKTSLKFDEVFLADNVDTGEWFFGTLQPCYNNFREDINVLNEAIYNDLQTNSADFDAGFYRSIIPGAVSVCAGLLLVMLLMYFILVYYVKQIAEAGVCHDKAFVAVNFSVAGVDEFEDILNMIDIFTALFFVVFKVVHNAFFNVKP